MTKVDGFFDGYLSLFFVFYLKTKVTNITVFVPFWDPEKRSFLSR